MIKDQKGHRIYKNTLQRVASRIHPELQINSSLINPAYCHYKHQRYDHIEEPVHIPAPEYGSPADRQTVVKVLLLLMEQIEELNEGGKKSESHADPPEIKGSATDPEKCIFCVKTQTGHGKDAVKDESSPASFTQLMKHFADVISFHLHLCDKYFL